MPTQRLTIQEAAEQLGVSEVTVRRRLKAGQLHGDQEPTAQGHRWIVLLDIPDQPTDHEADQTTTQEVITDQSPPTQPDHRLVEELQDRIGSLERHLEDRKREHDRDRDDWRDEIQRLHVLLAREQETLQQSIQALTTRIGELPAQTAQRATETREEELHHLYLAEFVQPVSSMVFSMVPLTVGVFVVFFRDQAAQRIENVVYVLLLVAFALLLYQSLWGVRRTRSLREQLVADGTITAADVERARKSLRMPYTPLPERILAWVALGTCIVALILLLVGAVIKQM